MGKPAQSLSFAADFETTPSEDDCRVWAWGIAPVSPNPAVRIGTTIDSFMEVVLAQSCVVYFHNLKFDAMFIMPWLFANGYSHTNSQILKNKQFSAMVSGMGQFYSLRVKLGKKTIEFRDSLKKFPVPLEMLAKQFNLPVLKGELDHDWIRPVGHVPTPVERDYLERDVKIVSMAMFEALSAGMSKLTVGSDSLSEYRDIMGKSMNAMFPRLHVDLDKELRRAYRGGFTYADERFRGKDIKESGIVLDVNSLYPFVMYTMPLPYGKPKYTKTMPKDGLWIGSITFTAKIKKDHIPTIQLKSSSFFLPTEYQTKIDEPTNMYITNVDWELMNEHYDIEVYAMHGFWRFESSTDMFKDYIDKWSKIKAENKGAKREIAKLHLNSLYGKFATNPKVTSKMPVMKDGVVRFVEAPPTERAPVYTPVGVFITSHARAYTIRAAQVNYDRFLYCDTDSLHLLGTHLPELDIHPTRLGAWKLEYNFTRAYYIRAKAYLEEWAGGSEVRIAGLPRHVAATLRIDDLRDGLVLHGKLTPHAVPGGVVLRDTPYKLNLHGGEDVATLDSSPTEQERMTNEREHEGEEGAAEAGGGSTGAGCVRTSDGLSFRATGRPAEPHARRRCRGWPEDAWRLGSRSRE